MLKIEMETNEEFLAYAKEYCQDSARYAELLEQSRHLTLEEIYQEIELIIFGNILARTWQGEEPEMAEYEKMLIRDILKIGYE